MQVFLKKSQHTGWKPRLYTPPPRQPVYWLELFQRIKPVRGQGGVEEGMKEREERSKGGEQGFLIRNYLTWWKPQSCGLYAGSWRGIRTSVQCTPMSKRLRTRKADGISFNLESIG